MDFKKLFQGLARLTDIVLGNGPFVALTTGATSSGTLGIDTPSAGYILYDNLAGGPFTVGETVTGGTSAATGVVVEDTGFRLVLDTVSGTFQNNETLTGGTSGATADADGAFTFYAFQMDDVVTGGTSGATATVVSVESDEILITGITGTFQNNELLTGSESDAEYLANGVVSFSNVGNYYLLRADGAANAVLERVTQTSGTTIEDVTILKNTELKGSFTDVRVTSGIVYAYTK